VWDERLGRYTSSRGGGADECYERQEWVKFSWLLMTYLIWRIVLVAVEYSTCAV
jgi:hypothetical protein